MQNDCKHFNVHIVTSELHAKRLIARPTLQSFKIINEDLAIVKLMKSSVLLNKPIYVGMCILDLSKLSIIMCLCKSTAIGRSCFSPIQIASATMSKRTISIKTWGKTAAAISCSATIMLRWSASLRTKRMACHPLNLSVSEARCTACSYPTPRKRKRPKG